MAEITLTPEAAHPTLDALAQAVRELAGQRRVDRAQLREIADEMDWYADEYVRAKREWARGAAAFAEHLRKES